MGKKNVDEILKSLNSDYSYYLGDNVGREITSFKRDYNNGRIAQIEDLYCQILGISRIDKTGKAFIRNLKKKAMRSSMFKKMRKNRLRIRKQISRDDK